MPLVIKEGASAAPRQIPKAKTQVGRICQIIDVGVQPNVKFKPARKVLITFELPKDLIEEGDHKGKPLLISQEYTVSFDPKANLRKELIDKLGVGTVDDEGRLSLDIFTLLGQTALVTIMHKKGKDRTYANIAGISQLPEEITVPAAVHEPLALNLEEFDEAVFEKLPEWIQKKINNRIVTASNNTAVSEDGDF